MMITVLYLNSQCEHYALLVICHKYQFAYLLCHPFCPFFTYITRPRAFVYKYIPHVYQQYSRNHGNSVSLFKYTIFYIGHLNSSRPSCFTAQINCSTYKFCIKIYINSPIYTLDLPQKSYKEWHEIKLKHK